MDGKGLALASRTHGALKALRWNERKCTRSRSMWCGTIRASSGKGFGDKPEEPSESGSQKKMSKRGTSASRPGVKSLKERKAQAEAMVAAAEAAREEDLSDEPIQEVSPIVNNRILTRIIIFSGVPVATAFALFPVFYYLKTVKGVDIPNAAVFFIQTFVFGGGLFGITYGAVSASWSPTREGSFLGIEEFKENLGSLMKGNQR